MAKKEKTLNTCIRDEDCYDYTKKYEDEIYPLVVQIKELCKYNRIPMFFSIAVANDKTKTVYKNECELAYTQRHLTDNRIVKMLRALNNFKFDLPDDVRSAVYKVLDYCDSVMSSKGSTLGEMHLTEDMFDTINMICNGASDVLPERQFNDLAEEEDLIIPKIFEYDEIDEE